MKILLPFLVLFISISSFAQNNYSLQYDGTDDYVDLPSNNTFALGSDSNLTIMTWINTTVTSGSSSIIQGWYGFGYQVYLSNGLINFVLREPNGNGVGLLSTSSVNDGNWHNITTVLEGNDVRIYIDGSIDNQGVFNNTVSGNGTDNLSLGHSPWASEYFNGNIDDVQMWNIALDSVTIDQYMNCPPTGNENNLVAYWDFEEGISSPSTINDLTSNSNDGTLNNGVVWSSDVPTFNCPIDTCTYTDTTFVTVYDTITFYDTVHIAVTDTLIMDITLTGVPSPNNSNTMLVYPNPANTMVNIDNGDYASMSGYSLKILNSLGQEVFNSNITVPMFSIPVSTIGPEGTYYIQVLDDNTDIIKIKTLILQ